MPGLDVHIATFCPISIINTEKLRNNILSVLKLRIILLESKLDTHIIILILGKTKAIPLEGIPVAHAAVAEVDLGALRESVLLGGDYEVIVLWDVFQEDVPNVERLLLG
jgi:hypothetical protein